MILYLVKSSFSLFILLVVYHLLLEKEKMHNFNRFYLLFCLVFSLILPLVTIQVVTETIEPVKQTYKYVMENIPIQNKIVLEQSQNYTFIILWFFYGLVTSVLLFRYIRNLLKIGSIIKSNTVVGYKNANCVLLDQCILPYTFLNYIFLNKSDYQGQKIEKELLNHEIIHVTQKHTLDVLFIETLKTVFWFNPLFRFYKKAIQLNHEFLADENVVNSIKDVSYYQNLLLGYSYTKPTSQLTSNLNYSITKKRFIMMTKKVSKTRILVSKMVLFPLFTGLIFFTCIESSGQVNRVLNSVGSNYQIATYSGKPNSGWIAKSRKMEYHLTKQPEIMMSSSFSLKGMKINEAAFQNVIEKISNYVLSTYESPKGIDKNQEVARISFFLKKDGSLSDIKIINKKGTETEKEMVRILKLGAQFVPAIKYGDADWDSVEVQVDFWPIDLGNSVDRNGPEYKVGTKNDTEKQLVNSQEKFAISYDTTSVKGPSFPGGMVEFYKFVGKNFKIPTEASKNKIEGKVNMEFTVEKDGSLSGFKVEKDLGFGLGTEGIRVLKLSPKWIPATKDGVPVQVMYSLPITIKAKE